MAAESKEGLKVGLAATGSSFTFGLYNGGKYRKDPYFSTSKRLADFGRDTLIGVATGGLSRYAYILRLDSLLTSRIAIMSDEEIQASIAGKNVALNKLWSTSTQGAEKALESLSRARSFKLPAGITRADLIAYRELIMRNIAKRAALKGITPGQLPANDVGLLRLKIIAQALQKSILR